MPHWLEKGPSLGWLGSHLVNSYCNQPLSAPSQVAKDSPGSSILIGSVLRGRYPPRISYERFCLSSTVYAFLRQFALVISQHVPSSSSTMYSHGRARGKGRGRGSYWRGRGRHGLRVLGRGRGKGFYHRYGDPRDRQGGLRLCPVAVHHKWTTKACPWSLRSRSLSLPCRLSTTSPMPLPPPSRPVVT